MPMVIPTRDELDRMNWRQRDAWRKRLGSVLKETVAARAMLDVSVEPAPEPKAVDGDVSRCGTCGAWQWRGVCRVVHSV